MEVREVEDVVLLEETKTTDPILTRIVNYEPFSHISPKLKSSPINELPDIRTQEALVVYDLLCVMRGIGGIYIRFNKDYDPHSGEEPQFRLVKRMDASLKSFCSKIVNLGKYYIMLRKASEQWSGDRYGIVLQRLGFELRSYLNDVYLKFILDELESKFMEKGRFSLREFKQIVNNSKLHQEMQILYHIKNKIDQEMDMRSKIDPDKIKFSNLLAELRGINNETTNPTTSTTDNMRNEDNTLEDKYSVFIDGDYFPVAKGGVIINVIVSVINDCLGDLHAVQFMKQLLEAISGSYCDTLHQWMTQGILNDPHDEFMINDTMKHFKGVINNPIEYERIWLTQYCVKRDGLLAKFSMGNNKELLFKIVMTGKLLNLTRTSLQMSQLPMPNQLDEIMTPVSIIDMFEGTKFELYIDRWYQRANDLSLQLFYGNYGIQEILICLQRRFFGYCNDQIFQRLLHNNLNELTKRHNIEQRQMSNNKLVQFLRHEKQLQISEGTTTNDDIILALLSVSYDRYSFRENMLEENERYNSFEENFNELIGHDNNNNNNNINKFTNALLQDINKDKSLGTTGTTTGTTATRTNNELKSNIHYLTFDVSIPYPINVIINRVNITQYQTVSRYFHLIQYHSTLLDEIWLEINKNKIWRYTGYSTDVHYKIIRRSRIIHMKMNHFIKCLNEIIIRESIDKEMSNVMNGKFTNIIDLQNELEIRLSNILGNNNLLQLMDIQLQMFDIIQIFCKFIASSRSKLCQLDYNLYERYLSQRSNAKKATTTTIQAYDEDKSIEIISQLNQFLTTIQIRFKQHFIAFCEGLDINSHNNLDNMNTNDNDNNSWPLNERLLNALIGQRVTS
ncbi:similar to Saccharomyces cerevisiae YHR172W SPC97 Component of the microtubule-nucleating Tub4p (gamma-tubulin) complex [Maudiozyma barnettii]|uniref:Spindle pole body component n=1 Tax=Maudiozyma barnettii TaxID=61262 RepID=A0A8H2VFW7_9SACH|nr:Spc97p [Kazachstania barnettii]CAB4254869.1 similar to Saccharomyces cerevisiae YHR172W SPC97 Component of the microtubule-nucleating Tub4p (gamma-tubulin) complex [Kazachstania barnettii]CAD1783099.1 similar to Saccharomyces cerevisiae YHR172W SPC97 Component of the microtubule-nucleating Tub4p (gamma-tubulin) complex [Kazachstania barnettii]